MTHDTRHSATMVPPCTVILSVSSERRQKSRHSPSRACVSFLVPPKDERGNKGQQAPRGEALGREGVSVCRGVSVWRQLLVANEWNRLGTRRRVNPLVSLMWMAFILGAGRLQYNATPQPDLENIEVGIQRPRCFHTQETKHRSLGDVVLFSLPPPSSLSPLNTDSRRRAIFIESPAKFDLDGTRYFPNNQRGFEATTHLALLRIKRCYCISNTILPLSYLIQSTVPKSCFFKLVFARSAAKGYDGAMLRTSTIPQSS